MAAERMPKSRSGARAPKPHLVELTIGLPEVVKHVRSQTSEPSTLSTLCTTTDSLSAFVYEKYESSRSASAPGTCTQSAYVYSDNVAVYHLKIYLANSYIRFAYALDGNTNAWTDIYFVNVSQTIVNGGLFLNKGSVDFLHLIIQ